MNAINDVESAWQSYQTTLDCLRIATHAVSINEMVLLEKTGFVGFSLQDAHRQIAVSRSNADDYVVLAMWAAFERVLLAAVQNESQRMLEGSPSDLTTAVHGKMVQEIEYWRIDQVLDLFKEVVDANLIGQAKQIKQYRDWVAHRNTKKASPPIIAPQSAYVILTEILRRLPERR